MGAHELLDEDADAERLYKTLREKLKPVAKDSRVGKEI